jgi:hypothetical protein
MKTALNIATVLVASLANIFSGFILVAVGRSHARLFSEQLNSELPVITQLSVAYTASIAPIVLGILLGLVTLVGLTLILRSEKMRWSFPHLLSLSFLAVILNLMFVAFAVSVPLFRITYSMSE